MKLRKLEIQFFKQIAIQSWNEEDRVDWSMVAQSASQHSDVIFKKNWNHLHLVSLRKSHMVLNLRKSEIQCFKWIRIRSWNGGDMTNRSNAMQRAYCYRITYESNSFWLFGLNFGPLLLGSFWWKLSLLGFHFSLTLSLFAGQFLVIWILSKF